MKLAYCIALVLALSACAKPKDGKDGINGNNGAIGQNGTDGIDGQNGTDGVKGDTGVKGDAGQNGTNGSDGTVIKPIQFCPDEKDPSAFTEVGFCIDGKLYAVYSENNGFLTYVREGIYSSNAHGSKCTFYVSGCDIKILK